MTKTPGFSKGRKVYPKQAGSLPVMNIEMVSYSQHQDINLIVKLAQAALGPALRQELERSRMFNGGDCLHACLCAYLDVMTAHPKLVEEWTLVVGYLDHKDAPGVWHCWLEFAAHIVSPSNLTRGNPFYVMERGDYYPKNQVDLDRLHKFDFKAVKNFWRNTGLTRTAVRRLTDATGLPDSAFITRPR